LTIFRGGAECDGHAVPVTGLSPADDASFAITEELTMKAITKLAAWFDPIPPEHRALAAAFDAEAQAYGWERMYAPMGILGAISMTLFGVMD